MTAPERKETAAAWKAWRALGVLLSVASAVGQVPAPHPNRKAHRHIAPLAPGLTAQAAPMLAIPDQTWNHGEGFGATYVDHGGWHDSTDGTNLTFADIHVEQGDEWGPFTWRSDVNDLHPKSPHPMRRMEGYLRPANAPGLPSVHPRYGQLGQTYVDQGAFEMFTPTTAWAGQKILVVLHAQSTALFPRDKDGKSWQWRQMYRGYFSADGLVRNEPQAGSASSFVGTDAADGLEVERPFLNTIVEWNPAAHDFWPIEAYAVLSVMHRPTTLQEQRVMQLRQAVKELLLANSNLNPLGENNQLTTSEFEQKVVFVVIGGSNGGMQSSFAVTRYPHLLHGCFAYVINPSYQRLYAEFDLERALAQLTGAGMGPLECTADDFLTWNQYAWAQGLEIHDQSALRLFVADQTYRPMCFGVGDEDTTSTGVNWARVIDGAVWRASGIVQSQSSFGSPSAHTFAWMCGENARHGGNVGPVTNPYTSATEYTSQNVALDFWPHAIAQRAAELNNPAPVPVPALTHTPRSSAQQLRGLDDPQEWWLGRAGDPLPAPLPTDPLVLDTAFHDAVNPGFTGNMPGGKESMFISNNLVFVGSADGFVSSFYVDLSQAKKPLRRYAQSPRLGHECHAIAKIADGGDWWLLAGTRRHLHKLDKLTLQPSAKVTLPYEVAQPHHVQCADVLPGHTGAEIVFATIHGGLCFYDLQLQPIFEWPEPGIVDFFAADGRITFLSSRGVVATVSFDANQAATLEAVSKAIPQQMLQNNPPQQDPPCQGRPFDLERMLGNAGPGGLVPIAISSWTGDEDRGTVRAHVPALGLLGLPFAPNLGGSVVDIATCKESTAGGASGLGDHALVLLADGRLQLRNQLGAFVAEKNLTAHASPTPTNPFSTYYPFGAQAHTMAVGELAGNAGSSGYNEEIVVATNTGLMWLHVDELAASGTVLPATWDPVSGAHVSGFWVEKDGPTLSPQPPAFADTQTQARTNQALQATWAMARRPGTSGLDPYLHLLDQRGVYWRVNHGGQVRLWERLSAAAGARAWDYVGTLSPTSPPSMTSNLVVQTLGPYQGILTTPFCPKETENTVAELTNNYIPNNWMARPLERVLMDGLFVHPMGGCVLHKPHDTVSGLGSGSEVWHWTFAPAADVYVGGTPVPMGQWGNLVQGLHARPSGEIDGLWASTATSTDKCPHHRMRSFNGDTLSINQQAIAAVNLEANTTGLILGCPGGRIRACKPGAMRTNDTTAHDIGSLASTPDDLGLGVSALAVRHEVVGTTPQVRIWFGTIAHPDPQPAGYTQPTSGLGDADVGVGAVHQVVWIPSNLPAQQFGPVSHTRTMNPTPSASRGASAVVGMALGNLLPTSGDELVVSTLSGDVIIYSADTMTELWRTHVHGAVGCYNSIRIEDLDNDGQVELYVAGSSGLWRFVRPGEL